MNPNTAADWAEEIFAWADKCKIPNGVIPRDKERLQALTEMHLNNYDIERHEFWGYEIDYLPEAIGQLHNLTTLDLSWNELTKLPESIGQLHNLTKLDLSCNHLPMLPESIGKLHNL
ncbi:leucine-rich repeat domain-containing protein, partial [Conchiformibius steedae]|uniref:leucine-rich repeat domain-containing protein n=1 Tax=Conchiformibius steedae TaxID=153493 RepID=UPI0026ECDA2F